MSRYRSLHRHFHSILKPGFSPCNSCVTYSPKSSFLSSLFRSLHAFSPQFDEGIGAEVSEAKKKKRLDDMFKEAVGLSKVVENSESESENGDTDVKRKLRELERSIKKLRSDSKIEEISKVKDSSEGKPKKLSALFAPQKENLKEPEKRREESSVCEKLSPDMEEFVRHLYVEGYFNKATNLPHNKLDFSCFKTSYARGFIKFAAERFGRDKQEIAKSLSCSDLKKIALFGCPSLERKCVFAAKSLRKFFEIQEDTVCSKCVLKNSCQFPNQSVWKSGDNKNLNLRVVMKVILLYALESVHPQLAIPDDIKTSVSKLLKEILKLSQTVA